MAYNELIKNFEKVRAYMREFYVYGFKSRTEYDAKSARSYFSSYLSLVADRKFKPEQHIKVLSNTRPYQGGSEYENSFGGVKYRLPYLPSLEEQAAMLKLLEPLSGKEAKTYEPVIAAIAGEVFGDGK